jgi:hypothetical protein
MDHPPYRHNLMSSNFHIFGPLKKHLAGKQSATDTNMKQAVTSWLQTLDNDLCYAGIQVLMPLCDKCLKVNVLMEV